MDLRFWQKKESKQFKVLAAGFQKRRSALLAEFKEKHEDVVSWAARRKINVNDVVSKGARTLAASFAAGAVLVSSGAAQISHAPAVKELHRELLEGNLPAFLSAKKDTSDRVKKILNTTRMSDENVLTEKLSKELNIKIVSELQGIRLNKTSGIIGYESHLTRYPGDNILTHFETSGDYKRYSHASMAGGPGAWGYIVPSRQALTEKDIERERYYLVAQTWLSPNWGSAATKEWFRHRKMIVINPQNGKAVVGVLEDAGPETGTGRAFGGSPEVMEELGLRGGGINVLMYFVDDPADQVPLGRYGL
ncbi:MAG: hypothetical protein A2172_03545 [Candidatus Woykebacteria bacterium RBG_13_40_15]|uniref:Uncharacterized protein n=1 Tax=Candidatus Woykebacteria bacterium RBG_13_40_15 TaxID=1802593 RepID=A0A1G1W5W6_9BACT|nr:MAG: hypothetical protein A2172_03545 [Candidatus Woykebacteria bacterium RBG_13_40_15]